MPIDNRALPDGTVLVARHKGETFKATVHIVEDERTYTVEGITKDGKPQVFKSPSSAGTAVTGIACNGWAFWTPEAEASAKTEKRNAEKAERAAAKEAAQAATPKSVKAEKPVDIDKEKAKRAKATSKPKPQATPV